MDAVPVVELKKLTGPELKSLVNRGILQIVKTTDKDPSELTYKDYPEYKKHAHLAGCEISISESSRKYKVPPPTISRWVKKGLINRIRKAGARVLIDEADVAYCAEVQTSRRGQGKWLFNKDRTPYTPTSRITENG